MRGLPTAGVSTANPWRLNVPVLLYMRGQTQFRLIQNHRRFARCLAVEPASAVLWMTSGGVAADHRATQCRKPRLSSVFELAHEFGSCHFRHVYGGISSSASPPITLPLCQTTDHASLDQVRGSVHRSDAVHAMRGSVTATGWLAADWKLGFSVVSRRGLPSTPILGRAVTSRTSEGHEPGDGHRQPVSQPRRPPGVLSDFVFHEHENTERRAVRPVACKRIEPPWTRPASQTTESCAARGAP